MTNISTACPFALVALQNSCAFTWRCFKGIDVHNSLTHGCSQASWEVAAIGHEIANVPLSAMPMQSGAQRADKQHFWKSTYVAHTDPENG